MAVQRKLHKTVAVYIIMLSLEIPLKAFMVYVVVALSLLTPSAKCYKRSYNIPDPQWTITTTVALGGVKQSRSAVTCACVPSSDAETDGVGDLQSMDKMAAVAIPPGYQLYGGKWYYKLHKTTQFWSTANKICEEAGAHLVIIDSKEEEEIIVQLLQDIDGPNNTWVHAGFHDLINEGQYQTVLGEPLVYVNWAPGEPADTFRVVDCGAIDLTGQMESAFCLTQRLFVCELPVNQD